MAEYKEYKVALNSWDMAVLEWIVYGTGRVSEQGSYDWRNATAKLKMLGFIEPHGDIWQLTIAGHTMVNTLIVKNEL